MSSPLEARPSTPDSQTLRRLARKLILLVIAKVAVLTAIWWIAIAPHPRPDTRPAAIEQWLAPAHSSTSAHTGHP